MTYSDQTYSDLLNEHRRKARAIEAAYAEFIVGNPSEDTDLRLAKFRVANREALDDLVELACQLDRIGVRHRETELEAIEEVGRGWRRTR